MSKSCTHKTIHDHVWRAVSQPPSKASLPPKPWTYICTICTKRFRWVEGKHHVYGNMECTKCGWAEIDAVLCSKQCRNKFNDMLKVRASESRARARASKAAKGTVRAVRDQRDGADPLLGGARSAGGEVSLLPVQGPHEGTLGDDASPSRSFLQLIPTKDQFWIHPANMCWIKGWKVGTCIVGDEGYGPDVIKITAIGEQTILAKCVLHKGKPYDSSESIWVLDCRDWKEVPDPGIRVCDPVVQ